MSHISILIVDDDLNKITSIISSITSVINDTLEISQASYVQEAIEYLQRKEFHLLITDLKMPLKHDGLPDDTGGEVLVKSLYRRRTKANVPMYIIGLTQFDELAKDLKNVWKVWHYDGSQEDWKISLRDLIFHISLVKSRINAEKIETVFVEGVTDRIIIESGLTLFYPEQMKDIYIDAIKSGGGASWVERKLFIWAKSLVVKSNEDKYLKAIGLFDDDIPGNASIDKIRGLIDINSAEGKTFLVRKSCYKYSPILKSIKAKGIIFPTTIEDLVSEDFWEYSLGQGWLTFRDKTKLVLDNEKISLDNNSLTIPKLLSEGFSKIEALVVLYKINGSAKMHFANHIRNSKKEKLITIKYLIEDFFNSLNINYS